MTLAHARQAANPECWSVQGSPLHTQDLLVFACSTANTRVRTVPGYSHPNIEAPRTPASTRVMSSTLMPASGSEAASPLGAVVSRLRGARRCQLERCLPSEAKATRLEALKTSAIVMWRGKGWVNGW
jgi:hypothetical protein